jgi:hypothetical protein
VSNSPNDKDDWSRGSASLFREARRAHDPTPLERARLDAILARIQATNTEASLGAKQASDVAVRSKGALLRQVAKVSLAALCVAAVAIPFIRANREPAEPARNARPAPSAHASSPTPVAVPSNAEPSGLPHTPDAADARDAPSRSQRRRPRRNAEVQRASRMDVVAVPAAATSAADAAPVRATAPSNATTVSPAARQESSSRATAPESNPQQASVARAAREAEPTLPPPAPTELGLLKRMNAALREADYEAALALCAEHERRWPHGVFEFEREGVRAIAACGEKADDAIPRAKRFLAAHPHAAIAMRVSSSCLARLPR